jgi:hypothetical protein
MKNIDLKQIGLAAEAFILVACINLIAPVVIISQLL